jgi:hypothetical protein
VRLRKTEPLDEGALTRIQAVSEFALLMIRVLLINCQIYTQTTNLLSEIFASLSHIVSGPQMLRSGNEL